MESDDDEETSAADDITSPGVRIGPDTIHAPLTIHIDEEINTKVSAAFDRALQQIRTRSQQTVLVVIDSGGGEVTAALRICDLIAANQQDLEIHTLATGNVMSAAALVFSMGKRRFASPNCTFMLHDVQCSHVGGRLSDLISETDEAKRLNAILWKTMSDRTAGRITAVTSNTDAYMSAARAVEVGLATETGYPRLVTRVVASTALEGVKTPATLQKRKKRR